jgi:hypothetical protein
MLASSCSHGLGVCTVRHQPQTTIRGSLTGRIVAARPDGTQRGSVWPGPARGGQAPADPIRS